MSTATDMLQAYIDAEAKVLAGQTVQWGEYRWTLADLADIRAGRAEWERKVAEETAASAGKPARSPIYLQF
jgi:hypothetical protein